MEEYELPHTEMPVKGVETADIVRLQMPLWKQKFNSNCYPNTTLFVLPTSTKQS